MVYYFDTSAGTFEDTGAVFNLSSDTAVFEAPSCGTYVLAINQPGGTYSYSLSADSSYIVNGAEKSFNVLVTRGANSPRLSGAQIMVVTTLSSGIQTYFFGNVTNDNCIITVYVDERAVKSEVYLISGTFDGTEIPLAASIS